MRGARFRVRCLRRRSWRRRVVRPGSGGAPAAGPTGDPGAVASAVARVAAVAAAPALAPAFVAATIRTLAAGATVTAGRSLRGA